MPGRLRILQGCYGLWHSLQCSTMNMTERALSAIARNSPRWKIASSQSKSLQQYNFSGPKALQAAWPGL
uniref:Uncharacterized protein n=1 Tax=Pseudomonas fluorescens (strain SBW25) TaxID=216595 RepID=A4V711_PSEFS|nr:hypothetical protein pQBR0290 [Pseudomonas fluorescens SBW25]